MPQYLSPGVYVEYVPPASLPIAGVATSVAGFIGVVADDVTMPEQPGKFESLLEFKSQFQLKKESNGEFAKDGDNYIALLGDDNKLILVKGSDGEAVTALVQEDGGKPVLFKDTNDDLVKVSVEDKDGNLVKDTDSNAVLVKDTDSNAILVKEDGGNPVLVKNNEGNPVPVPYTVAPENEPTLITSWEEFKTKFGDFQEGNKTLAHAVYGFFFNGGSRCHVLRVPAATDIDNPAEELEKFEAIDEITIVAIPGAISDVQHTAIIAHCTKMADRVAVLDGDANQEPSSVSGIRPVGLSQQGSYAAIYYPWIKVFDPVSGAPDTIPPSGHIAGIYARNDATRGVFKAPANEVVVNALDISRPISKAQQDGLNPEGINVIRSFKGTIKVWGARTMADNANADFRYISTRRYFNFLRESIDEGTQFAVFEPNNLALWQRIKRTVSDFLLNQWRDGALFGETPEKAFFVKCDAETNPKEVRELGQVVTLIGVAIVKPAEFVIFRIQQTAGE
ncbi:MAG: phage tail sheath family protein [Symploca sp. SIO3E6]|nr:phage tail sheath family protein [Caldora sp. SIO3E6]